MAEQRLIGRHRLAEGVYEMDGKTTNDQIRWKILTYMHDRNTNASSLRGKNGAAAKISDIRRDLKARYGLLQKQVMSNLRYLISQGWVEQQDVSRIIPTSTGQQVNRQTVYFAITAAGIDKIEGGSEFTPRERFSGITIEATGASIVTVGDGNQVHARHESGAGMLAELNAAVKQCGCLRPEEKMDAVVDIDTIQAQLARSEVDTTVVQSAWSSLQQLSKIGDLARLVSKVGDFVFELVN
ncbi:MAG: hypothetical protein R3C49_26710 [Planctomycetaceae bacterium]